MHWGARSLMYVCFWNERHNLVRNSCKERRHTLWHILYSTPGTSSNSPPLSRDSPSFYTGIWFLVFSLLPLKPKWSLQKTGEKQKNSYFICTHLIRLLFSLWWMFKPDYLGVVVNGQKWLFCDLQRFCIINSWAIVAMQSSLTATWGCSTGCWELDDPRLQPVS